MASSSKDAGQSSASDNAARVLAAHATPLPPITSNDFGKTFHQFTDCRVLLIGSGTHGTHEFYEARAAITKHLILHHGFNIVAIEADWPDAEVLDRYVRRRPVPVAAEGDDPFEHAFQRFPTWVWRNREMHDFVEWLRDFNKGKGPTKCTGIYGLDLYSMEESMRAVTNYLGHVDGKMAQLARTRYGRLRPWLDTAEDHDLDELARVFRDYEGQLVDMVRDIQSKRSEYAKSSYADEEEYHGADQNANLIAEAEKFYSAMHNSLEDVWNIRAKHMFQTLNRVLEHRGNKSKAIVWAHNSHAGNAQGTALGWGPSAISLGQLCKEDPFYGNKVLNLGCFTYSGDVAAAEGWDEEMKIINLKPPTRERSIEALAHSTGRERFFVDLREGVADSDLRTELSKLPRPERSIGAIYDPDENDDSLYTNAELPKQFDGMLYFDKTTAIKPLHVHGAHSEKRGVFMDQMYPFGL